LVNRYGTPQARSSEDYATEDEVVAAARNAQRVISHAPLIRS